MDLGSNSFHLLVADAHPDGSFEPLARDKEMLRLGSVVAKNGVVGEEAAAAAVETVARFKALAVSLGADEIVACATSALREARDSLTVVDRIEDVTGVKVRVISGKDEARLIFDAVRTSVVIDPAPALAMDLGGGRPQARCRPTDRFARKERPSFRLRPQAGDRGGDEPHPPSAAAVHLGCRGACGRRK
jgi:exopolyphosphatase/guanosine-5'-triphosphate,3'-diphosphate pyrophosphatase